MMKIYAIIDMQSTHLLLWTITAVFCELSSTFVLISEFTLVNFVNFHGLIMRNYHEK